MKTNEEQKSCLRRTCVNALLFTLLTYSTNISAITFGEPDGDGHPNVGAIVVNGPDGPWQLCSGTLIHERVFLTAGHCAFAIEVFGIPLDQLYVTFNSENALDPASWIPVAAALSHPDFNMFHVRSDSHTHDVGVLVLAEPVTSITPATLAPAGFLNDLKRAKQLSPSSTFVVVGYGSSLVWPPPEIIWDNGYRRVAESSFRGLNDSFLFMSQNSATGDGGTGYGDSGGPTFWVQADGSEILVSVTSWGDPKLVATNISFRIDTLDALEFINAIITGLP